MPPNLAQAASDKSGSVVAGANAGTRLRDVPPPHGRRRRRHLEGETDAAGLLRGDLARMLLQSVPMG